MDRATRTDLLQTISDQKDQIQKYQGKLSSLVSSYKGLLKEKDALQSTLSALSSKDDKKKTITSKEGKNEEKEVVDDPLTVSGQEQRGQDDLQEQISTLTTSMTTLMKEKSKMEANYQAEKKVLKQEHEETLMRLKKEIRDEKNKNEQLDSQLQELKSKIRNEQYDREKEQNDYGVMLRELQKVVASERMIKEQVEHQLEEAKDVLNEKEKQPDIAEQYESMIGNLSEELDAVRLRLKEYEISAAKPPPLLLELQQEMAQIKASHRIAVQQEQRRANDAEDSLHAIAQQSEERVSGLENKLSELSDVVGNYEKLRYQDQTSIHKLKERVTQLDLENTALARAAHGIPDNQNEEDENNMDVQALVDKLTRLKGMLKLANQRSERPVNIEELLKQDDPASIDEDVTHRKCHEELCQLKEEFERYKLRAQSVLKNKSSKDAGHNKEYEHLQNQNCELRDKVKNLRISAEDQEQEYKNIIDDLRQSITKRSAVHKSELVVLEAEFKQKISELEGQLHKHRDRTIALLAEKDREVDSLKLRGGQRMDMDYLQSSLRGVDRPSETNQNTGSNYPITSEENEAVYELLSKTSPESNTQDRTLLHYTHEKARRDVEIAHLRKQKHEAEVALRELQLTVSAKQEHYADQIDLLKEEIRKLERGKNRESANLEYLKNVVFRYMICSDTHGKIQMLNAIGTILQFSPAEKEKVHSYLRSWFGVTYSSQNAATGRT